MQKILMSAPTYFNVSYVINPHMEKNVGGNTSFASKQWNNLKNALIYVGAEIALVEPQPNLPDFVFTANAALIYKNLAIVSTFKHPERQGETLHYMKWFQDNGFETITLESENFEGAGDALYDKKMPRLFVGYGWRTDLSAIEKLKKYIDLEIVPLELVNANFYHLDTCFCPLENGYYMIHMAAFSKKSQEWLNTNLAGKIVPVGRIDAFDFACNAVELNNTIILNKASEGLQRDLRKIKCEIIEVTLTDFLKAGGSAKCLTLKLKDGNFFDLKSV